MNELPPSSKYRVTPQAPVDDKERADLTDRLAAEFTEGRISQDNYLVLLDTVYRANKLGELVEVVQVLPAKATYKVPEIVAQDGSQLPDTVSSNKKVVAVTVAALIGLLILIMIVVFLLALMF